MLPKRKSVSPPLSWVPCDQTERIRRSRARRLKHPASRYLEIKHLRNFRECFFVSREHRVNTQLFNSFNFHYFHKWLVGRSGRVFIYGFRFCQKSAQFSVPSSPSSSRVQNTQKSALPTTLIFKTISGSVNTAVNTDRDFQGQHRQDSHSIKSSSFE